VLAAGNPWAVKAALRAAASRSGADPELAMRREARRAAPGCWIVDGNYDSELGGLVVDAADTVIWLDPPLSTALVRLWRRTAHRIRDHVELWNGNHESWWNALWGGKSLFAWAVRSHARHRRDWPARFAAHPRFVRLRTTADAESWLAYNAPVTSRTDSRGS